MIQKHKIACAVYGQQTGGTIDGAAPVCNPNDSLNRDVLVPNSHVAVIGIAGSEETKLKASSLRNQSSTIAQRLVWTNTVVCGEYFLEEKNKEKN